MPWMRFWRRRPAPSARRGTAASSSRRIEEETGIQARVITGPEEARLIHQAAVYGVDVASGRAVVIDIGGGSVEITLGTSTSIQLARSFKIGVIRLTERFVKSDPLSERDERRLTKAIASDIDRHCEQITSVGFDRVIGTSGTILSIGALAATAAQGHAANRSAQPAHLGQADSAPAKGARGPRHRAADWPFPAWIRAARTWSSPDPCSSIRFCAASAPRSSRCAISPCARASSSTTSGPTSGRSRRSTRFPTSAAAASSSWPSGATTTPTTRSRWRASRSRCSTRRAQSMA